MNIYSRVALTGVEEYTQPKGETVEKKRNSEHQNLSLKMSAINPTVFINLV